MQLTNDEAMRLVTQGADALRQGRAGEARDLLERVTRTGRANGQIWLLLATACRGAGDLVGEEAALDQLIALEPRMVRARIMKADCRAKAGDDRGALGFYETSLLIAADQQTPPDLATELQRVEALVEAAKESADRRREAALVALGVPPEARSPRFQQSLDILAGRKQIYVQEPTGYYFPGLPQIQYYDPADFDWVPAVEAATDAIRAELMTLLAERRDGFRPYLQGDRNKARMDENRLLDSADWSALFLCENGARDEAMIARCPATWAAMQQAPMPRIAMSPTVMFSLLKPGAWIAPHTGMFNTRLVCHLPLIVPPGCRFRVGNDTREWREGKLFIFDDTIQHEAWNDGDQERIVLIFDIWRPELSEQERREFGAFVASTGAQES
jgi:aspartyl/asparaginyl beta-hydroxylase (cupin superfamily)